MRRSVDRDAHLEDLGVAAEIGRIEAALDRARAGGAGEHSTRLRVLAAQMAGSAADLRAAVHEPVAVLRGTLGAPDPAALLVPLVEARAHLGGGSEGLAARIDAVAGPAATVRADAGARRRH